MQASTHFGKIVLRVSLLHPPRPNHADARRNLAQPCPDPPCLL